MKLFLIWQDENDDFDIYKSAVVAAKDEEEARNTHPCSGVQMSKRDWEDKYDGFTLCGYWTSSIEHVSVKYLGEAAKGISKGVICCKSCTAG